MSCHNSIRKHNTYFEPDVVCATALSPTLLLIAEVVIDSPSLKDLEPKIAPEIVPSLFCFHRYNVGTPFGALATFLTGMLGIADD